METASWIERTKRRHTLALNWQSDGAIPLSIFCEAGMRRQWGRWFSDPNVILDWELEMVRRQVAIGSDIMPVLHAMFSCAVINSMIGAGVLYHENGPVYPPFITDWSIFDSLKRPSMDAGLMPQVKRTMQLLRENGPDYAYVSAPYFHSILTTAAVLRGPAEFYMDVALNPERAHQLLQFVADVFVEAWTHLFKWFGHPFQPTVSQGGVYFSDMIHLSDDCCVNLSPAQIEEFDLDYMRQVSERMGGITFCTHYCIVRPRALAKHCLEPICRTPFMKALFNGYTPEFFLENYAIFDRRLALISGLGDYVERFGATPEQRLENFREWARDFCQRFQGKSGLIIQLNAPSVEEGQELFRVWEKVNSWD